MEIVYFRMPLQYSGVTTKYSEKHKAIDLGYNSNYGGKKAPVYAISDGVVSRIRSTQASGNILEIRYNYNGFTWISQFCHLSAIHVSVNQRVSMGQHVANMGNTGTAASGYHLHYALYKCPEGTKTPTSKYAVNPLSFTFAYDDQSVALKSKSLVVRVYGLPVDRDINKAQLKVEGDLNCRSSAHGTILGECVNGIYDILAKKKMSPYTWYQIGRGRWVANVKGKVILL